MLETLLVAVFSLFLWLCLSSHASTRKKHHCETCGSSDDTQPVHLLPAPWSTTREEIQTVEVAEIKGVQPISESLKRRNLAKEVGAEVSLGHKRSSRDDR